MSAQKKIDPPCDEITIEDCFGFDPSAPDLSVLELDSPGTGHNNSLIREADRARKMGASKEDTVARLSELYDSDRRDYDTAPKGQLTGHGATPARRWSGSHQCPHSIRPSWSDSSG